jgi:hypothetical protein
MKAEGEFCLYFGFIEEREEMEFPVPEKEVLEIPEEVGDDDLKEK